ncbi:hypothetical protein ACOME3_006851 [Neoechinorhynchus agilis]
MNIAFVFKCTSKCSYWRKRFRLLLHSARVIERAYFRFINAHHLNGLLESTQSQYTSLCSPTQPTEFKCDERQTLGKRFKRAIDALKTTSHLYIVHKASGELEITTSWSAGCSIRLAQSTESLNVLMDVMANCNRSPNHEAIIQCILSLLLNISICKQSVQSFVDYLEANINSDQVDPEHNCVLFLTCLLIRHSKNPQTLAFSSVLLGKVLRHAPSLAICVQTNSYWMGKLNSLKRTIPCLPVQTNFRPIALEPAWALRSTKRIVKSPLDAYLYLMRKLSIQGNAKAKIARGINAKT